MPNIVPAVHEGEFLGVEIIVRNDRPPCAFYGFFGAGRALIDNKGNACALEGSHTPCAMEMMNQKPCWEKCKRFNTENNRDVIEQMLDGCKIFPDEMYPKNKNSWEGIRLREWFEKITKTNP